MVGMTGFAFARFGGGISAMKSLARFDIRPHLVMTGDAQRFLVALVERRVAFGALVFHLLMRRRQRPRHDQFFQGIGAGRRRQEQKRCPDHQPYYVLPFCHRVVLSVAGCFQRGPFLIKVHCNHMHDGGNHQHEEQGKVQHMPQRK